MHWNSFADFLAMGEHGVYVWGSFVVMAALMIAEPLLLIGSRKKLIVRLRRQHRAEALEAEAQKSQEGAP